MLQCVCNLEKCCNSKACCPEERLGPCESQLELSAPTSDPSSNFCETLDGSSEFGSLILLSVKKNSLIHKRGKETGVLPWSAPALLISFILNFDYIFVCVCVHEGICCSIWKSEDNLDSNSLLSPCGLLGSNSGYQAGHQAP